MHAPLKIKNAAHFHARDVRRLMRGGGDGGQGGWCSQCDACVAAQRQMVERSVAWRRNYTSDAPHLLLHSHACARVQHNSRGALQRHQWAYQRNFIYQFQSAATNSTPNMSPQFPGNNVTENRSGRVTLSCWDSMRLRSSSFRNVPKMSIRRRKDEQTFP